jgi:hypothetical protein
LGECFCHFNGIGKPSHTGTDYQKISFQLLLLVR